MRAVTAVLLTIALLFGTVECKTSCVQETCKKAPPCHGQKTVRTCANELVVDRPAAVAAVTVEPVYELMAVGRSVAADPVGQRGVAVEIVPPLRI